MKPRFLLAILSPVLALSLMVGCASNNGAPATQPSAVHTLTAEYQAFGLAVDVLTQAKAAGLIDAKTDAYVTPILEAAQAALDTAKAQALAGDQASAADGIAQADAALQKLAPIIQQANAGLAKKKGK